MNRRKLLATSGIGIASIAGCYGLGQTLTAEDSAAGTDGTSADGSSPAGEDATDSPAQDNASATDADAENTTDAEEEKEQEQEQEQSQSAPEGDPRNAIEIAEHELVFEPADDPNYDSDELYLHGLIRNASEHPLRDVRLDGYVFASDEPVGHEYLEYAALEGSGERRFELPFFVENPEQVDRYEFEVTAAQWA